MSKPADRARTTVSATVTPDVKQRVAVRAIEEDRDVSRVLARALDVYLALPPDDAERMVREARNGTAPKATDG